MRADKEAALLGDRNPTAGRAEGASAALLEASHRADVGGCRRALLAGADPDALDPLHGLGALTLAVDARAPSSSACVEELLKWCEPKKTGKNGETALMRAAGLGMDECVELLLPVSDVDAATIGGESTALMEAAYLCESGCLRLLAPVSNVEQRGRHGQTALDLAVQEGFDEGAEIIRAEMSRREAVLIDGACLAPWPPAGSGRKAL